MLLHKRFGGSLEAPGSCYLSLSFGAWSGGVVYSVRSPYWTTWLGDKGTLPWPCAM